jgi:uncharacterized RDD family membrane protein YckC
MDDRYLVTTPENIPITYDLAGVGSRFVATLVDTMITVAVETGMLLAVLLVARIAPVASFLDQLQNDVIAYLFALVFLFYSINVVGYPLLFEAIWNGQTPGKRLVGIRVISDDGGPLTLVAAIIRNVLRVVDSLPIYYIIGAAVMLLDQKSRRLGDLAAGTLCVKERRDVTLEQVMRPSPGVAVAEPPQPAAFDNLSRLSYDDYYLVKEYLARRGKLAPAAAQALAEQIAERVAKKLGVEREKLEAPESFLARVSAAMESRPRR